MNTLSPPPILEHLSALGDETRTRILVLLERSEFTVTELCATLQAPQPTVSRHLRTLADDGWVASRADGRNRHYRLADDLGEAPRDLWRVVRARLEGGAVYAQQVGGVELNPDTAGLRPDASRETSGALLSGCQARLWCAHGTG